MVFQSEQTFFWQWLSELRAKSTTQRLFRATNTHIVSSIQPITPRQAVSQEAIAAIGHVWAALRHLDGTYSMWMYFVTTRLPLFFNLQSRFTIIFWTVKLQTVGNLFVFVLFLLKFSMIFYTFSTSKVYHCIKARTAHFKLLLLSFCILCVFVKLRSCVRPASLVFFLLDF